MSVCSALVDGGGGLLRLRAAYQWEPALLPRVAKDHKASTFVRAITEPCLETVHVALMMPKAKLE